MIFRRTQSFRSVIEELTLIQLVKYLQEGFKVWVMVKYKNRTNYRRIELTKNGKSIKLVQRTSTRK